jgi:hypothetical protein
MNNIIREDNITPKTTLVLQPMPEQLLTVKDVAEMQCCNRSQSPQNWIAAILKTWLVQVPCVYVSRVFG